MRNLWSASGITLTVDSEGFISAKHKYQGDLIIDGEYDTKEECRRDAVNVLKHKKHKKQEQAASAHINKTFFS
tara:strand:- start:397 stop:615 length:219 start_codon:yes stop_codon:yes gene_type:complete